MGTAVCDVPAKPLAGASWHTRKVTNGRTRKPHVETVSLAVCAVAWGALGRHSAFAAEIVRIGIAAPFSGAAATYGQDTKRGAELAAEQINAKGGILGGRQIELVYEDDKGSPQGGVAAVQKLMSVGRGSRQSRAVPTSSVVLAESSVTKGRILHVNAAAQADAITEQGSPWLFQVNNTVSANASAFNDVHRRKVEAEDRRLHGREYRVQQRRCWSC